MSRQQRIGKYNEQIEAKRSSAGDNKLGCAVWLWTDRDLDEFAICIIGRSLHKVQMTLKDLVEELGNV